MEEETKMFAEALRFLRDYYDEPDWDELAKELPILCNKYKGSKLFASLLLAVLDHIENIYRWKKSQMTSNDD